MERKPNGEEEERGQSSRVTINGNIDEKEDDDDEGLLSVLKKEIACHSLYGHLVESHLECLKMCLGHNMENIGNVIDPTTFVNNPNLLRANQSELDQFMEAYCMALNKVKEVIEEPQQESMAFINDMYSQLEELLMENP
ncbi:hypothetical protein DH2020_038492 [Rehmannia glutinosa]|uniref:KNOX2 domain-containing protein n=1 Tax=Rehmannia glutinosa TaxID=99300 RepID=A0ABR0UZ60_REHGL